MAGGQTGRWVMRAPEQLPAPRFRSNFYSRTRCGSRATLARVDAASSDPEGEGTADSVCRRLILYIHRAMVVE